MQLTNKHNLPEEIVAFSKRNTYNPGKSDITISRLIDSPRKAALTKIHWDDLTEDVHDRIPAMMGTALHAMFEAGAEGIDHLISEERLFCKVNGWNISGQIDSQRLHPDGTVTVRDYKTTNVWAVMNEKVEWENQLNLYAWLVEKVKGKKVVVIDIVAYIRDWKRREAANKPDYPQAMIVTIPIELWSQEKREKYLLDRLHIHAEADASVVLGGDIGKCSPAEQWRRDPTFAVYKAKNPDRAWRVFPTREEAEKFASEQKDVTVVERPAQAVRCASFCQVAQFCDQWKEENEVF